MSNGNVYITAYLVKLLELLHVLFLFALSIAMQDSRNSGCIRVLAARSVRLLFLDVLPLLSLADCRAANHAKHCAY